MSSWSAWTAVADAPRRAGLTGARVSPVPRTGRVFKSAMSVARAAVMAGSAWLIIVCDAAAIARSHGFQQSVRVRANFTIADAMRGQKYKILLLGQQLNIEAAKTANAPASQ
jgi:hypothetical protein